MGTVSKAEIPEEIVLAKAQEQELDARLDSYHENPNEGSPWEMVKDRIRVTLQRRQLNAACARSRNHHLAI